jgi:putative SOS response-associated peptidase YedK
MCGRYISPLEAAIEREFALPKRRNPMGSYRQSYNVAPTQRVPAVRESGGERTCDLLRWGLVPFWAKGIAPKLSTINARVETIATAASYRGPWKRGQRCILPAAGFYEWQVVGDRKQPWLIRVRDRDVFGLAGLWDASTTEAGETVESVTIITMPANPLMAEIHNAKARMPAILKVEDYAAWLAGSLKDAEACLAPFPQDRMEAWTVSTAVNSPKNDRPELIEPAAPVT